MARHTDRIHLLELHQGMAFAVVDKVDTEIQQSLSQASGAPVEALDLDTYMTMQRLVDAGVLQVGTGAKSLLFQSHMIQADRRKGQQHKLERDSALFKEAERKLKMVHLLKSGGFAAEALPTAHEVFHKGIEVLEVLQLSPSILTAQLKEQIHNVDAPEAVIDTLVLWMEEVSTLMTQYALGVQ